ncbi:hypothetical protein ENU1_024390 [Entamoeba nuttalli P19]|uniref:Uncharacterized protein n=2 Tax=Entamoeba nuttalli TaxID=412467 RepID=K2H465_ENTNP|nr:hypothetical protein ENU1_024390 [Entamoeba nuttalli P19]EKE42338.1 hypothetical protein ENU1_024390 [Entamoeba nuttalli P19]|eukprot:XP_008855325.1 hypothetical protein ENU1_024390 [Entamoeba nuttalli P19]
MKGKNFYCLMQSIPMNQYCNSKIFPSFDPIDSTPIVDENEPYHLKLCFCPLCQKGISVLLKERSRNVISWQYICRVIFYCLSVIHRKNGYFSLKYDVHWFIVDHWYLFSQLGQFRTNPNKWKKAILDAMIHCNLFESGKSTVNKTGVWKLHKYEAPWECTDSNCFEISSTQNETPFSCEYSQDNITIKSKDEKKFALPSLSSSYKYCMNDIESSFTLLPNLSEGLIENIKLENTDSFIQTNMQKIFS